jgi:hypothetical protein
MEAVDTVDDGDGAHNAGRRRPTTMGRRDFMYRAGAAGAIVWSVPVIRSVNIKGAGAGSPHPPPTTTTSTAPTTPPTTDAGGPPGGSPPPSVRATQDTTTIPQTTTSETAPAPTTTLPAVNISGETHHGGGGGVLPFTGADIASVARVGAAAVAAGAAIVVGTNKEDAPLPAPPARPETPRTGPDQTSP